MTAAQFTSTGYNQPALPRPADREAPAVTEYVDRKFTDADGDYLIVRTDAPVDAGAYLDASPGGVNVSRDDAPAVALAILEASGLSATTGPGTPYRVARAVRVLREHEAGRELRAERAARAAEALAGQAEAEKADAEALDAEALALFNAHRRAVGDYPLASLPDPDRWRAVARAARSLGVPSAAPVKPTWQIIPRDGLEPQVHLVNNETRRAWPFANRDVAEESLGWILEDPSRGYSRSFAELGLDPEGERVPRPFQLVECRTTEAQPRVQYGALDRDGERVALFSFRSTAAAHLATIEANPDGWVWTPLSQVADVTVL